MKEIRTLMDIDNLDFGELGCQGEFYSYQLRKAAREWKEELENLSGEHHVMFAFLGETTVKFARERKAIAEFLRFFCHLDLDEDAYWKKRLEVGKCHSTK